MNYKKLFSSLIFTFIFAISFLSMAGVAKAEIRTLTGWGWSSTLGHVSFNCDTAAVCGQSDYKVIIDSYTGLMSGYAWSSTVGWIKFEGDNTHDAPRLVDWSTNKVVGWARACVGTENRLCTGADRKDGWDGWIKLSDSGSSPSFFGSPDMTGKRGITYNNSTGYFVGYSWGSTNMGWLTFSRVRIIETSANLPTVTLTATPTYIDSGGYTDLRWTPKNANSCTASDSWSGDKTSTDGEKIERRSGLTGTFPKIFTITCTNAFGTDTATAKVYQNVQPSISPETSGGGGGGSPTLSLVPGCSSAGNAPQITLNWGAVLGATGYTVSRSLTQYGDYATIATVGGTATTYINDTGLSSNTIYYYKVQSIDASRLYTGNTRTVENCNSNTSNNTALKMWIREEADPTKTFTHTKTIKAGEDFTLEWIELFTPDVINFSDCDLRVRKNNESVFRQVEDVRFKIYTIQNAQPGIYKYKLSCKDKQAIGFETSYDGKVYSASGAVIKNTATGNDIEELTIVVKNSKINEQ